MRSTGSSASRPDARSGKEIGLFRAAPSAVDPGKLVRFAQPALHLLVEFGGLPDDDVMRPPSGTRLHGGRDPGVSDAAPGVEGQSDAVLRLLFDPDLRQPDPGELGHGAE